MMPLVLTPDDAAELRALVAELKSSHAAGISAEVLDRQALAQRKAAAVAKLVAWKEQPW